MASHAEHTQRSKVAHVANHRADTSTGMQWRWQNPLPQGNNLRMTFILGADAPFANFSRPTVRAIPNAGFN